MIADLLRELVLRSIREYQEPVPVRTYDEYGEITASGITTSGSSGSSGAAKRIPYNRELRAEMGRAIASWIAHLFATHPDAFAGEPTGQSRRRFPRTLPSYPTKTTSASFAHASSVPYKPVPADVRFSRDVNASRRATVDHLLRCRTSSSCPSGTPAFCSSSSATSASKPPIFGLTSASSAMDRRQRRPRRRRARAHLPAHLHPAQTPRLHRRLRLHPHRRRPSTRPRLTLALL
jgi:hypothetical protein